MLAGQGALGYLSWQPPPPVLGLQVIISTPFYVGARHQVPTLILER